VVRDHTDAEHRPGAVTRRDSRLTRHLGCLTNRVHLNSARHLPEAGAVEVNEGASQAQ
jgi:hypothetical protein